MIGRGGARGFTLLELLLVLALIGLLTALGGWGSAAMLRGWQLRRAVHQVFEDLKQARSIAEQGGNLVLVADRLVTRRTYLIFAPDQQSYRLVEWQDADDDGIPAHTETTEQWQRQLPAGVRFEIPAGVDRRACSNGAGVPGTAITFASPNGEPCLDQPCLKFDRQGFSLMGPGAVYLTDGRQGRALTMTRPGHVTLCRWTGERWD